MQEQLQQKEIALQERQRRLLFRASHRGLKELDIVLGQYAAAHLPSMNQHTLDEFEALLQFEDRDLLQWILREVPVPKALDSHLFQDILNYKITF